MPNKIPTEAEVQKALAPYVAETLPEVPQIDDGDDYIAAGEALKDTKRRQHALDELKRTMTRPLDETKRAILALFDPALTRLSRRETAIKTAIKVYNARLEDERRLLEAKLRQEQADKVTKIEAKVERLRERGRDGEAEALTESIPPLPIVVADKPVVSGISERSVWKAEIIDMLELAAAVALGQVPLGYILPNQSALDAQARSLKNGMRVPGVRAVEDKTVVARG